MKTEHAFVLLNIFMSIVLKTGNFASLLPHGVDNPNDIEVPSADESTEEISTLVPFTFYGVSYTSIWIASNGFLGFGDYTECCFSEFPHENPLIAVLWDDWEPGILYYRQTTTDAADLDATSTYVRRIYPAFNSFQATWALVATWSYFILWSTSNVFSNFQVILTSDGTISFAIFLYDRIDGIDEATAGIFAGDGANFYQLCGAATSAMENLPEMKQICTSEPGVFVFRMDSNNPGQGDYDCTSILTSTGAPEGSYFCQWSDASETSLELTFILTKPQTCGITALDTQKYEDGDNPSISDPTCEVEYTSDPTALTFTVDPEAVTPVCGIRVTGTTPKTLDVTLRSYYEDQFDTGDDVIFTFNCTTDTALPASAELYKNFDDIPIESIPLVSRTVQLQITAPNLADVLTVVEVGQLIQLTIIYDNTANNIEPYGVYVEDLTVGDTASFDGNTAVIIQSGCVVEQEPEEPWYMSRSFQQESLSATGLFISKSGFMSMARFSTQNKLFFKCVINFCFFIDRAPDRCTNSCTGGSRRKRSINETEVRLEVIYTSVVVSSLGKNHTNSEESITKEQRDEEDCVDELTVYLTVGALSLFDILSLILACILIWNIFHKRTKK